MTASNDLRHRFVTDATATSASYRQAMTQPGAVPVLAHGDVTASPLTPHLHPDVIAVVALVGVAYWQADEAGTTAGELPTDPHQRV